MNAQNVCGIVFLLLCASNIISAQTNKGTFWHVTDFHYDHTYLTSQLSCVRDVNSPSGLGNQWCDSPWTLVTKTINAMKKLQPDVDFILWTGDTVAHISNDKMNVTINMDVLANLTQAIKDVFPTTPVYATFGNHDYYPASQFPAVPNLIYNETAKLWKDWIKDEDQLANFRKGGYYTLKLSPTSKVRVLALNTNLYYKSDKVTVNETDPAGQLLWMRQVLQDARSNNENVILAAHIPPGVHTPRGVQWYQDRFLQAFIDVITDHADVIKVMHFGHEHYDGFRIFNDTSGRPVIPLYVAPSVTPWRFKLSQGDIGDPHNPGIRLVTYDRDTGDNLDIQQYRLDLSQAISQGNGEFSLLYSFTYSYNVNDISATSLDDVITRLHDDEELLTTYYNYTLVGAQFKPCDQTCRTRILCGFRHHASAEYDQCVGDNSDPTGNGQKISLHNSLFVLLLMFCYLLFE